MRHLAGRFLNNVSSSPLQSAVAGGLASAGLSVGGNLVSEEGRDKGAARIALEALGAGALGAGVGSQIPELLTGPGVVKSMKNMLPADQQKNLANIPSQRLSAQEAKDFERLKRGINKVEPYLAAPVSGLGLLAAGGLGGQIGGGVANLGNMAGLAIDPESPGSSNTQGSRMSMRTQQLPMY
jgi:hypothetical protein